MVTFVSFPIENYSWDWQENNDTCASRHGNFFDMHSNIASSVLLQSREYNTKYLFCHLLQFCEELCYTDFKLYVNTGDVIWQNLFELSDMRNMQLNECCNTI